MPQALGLGGGDDLVMRRGGDEVGDLPAVLRIIDPLLRRQAAEVIRLGIAPQGLARTLGVFVEVGHRELAYAAVHGVAPAQADVIGLGDGAPLAVHAEGRDDVVHVLVGAEVQEQGRVALQPQREGGHHGALDAMGPVMLQGLLHRAGGVALGFEVLREIDEEVLDGLRGGEPPERARRGQAEASLLGESGAGGVRHGCRSIRPQGLLKERVRRCFRIG